MGTVGSNVIFAIGATGASKAAGQFAIVGAAIVGVGKAVADVMKTAEEFRMTFQRMSDEQIRNTMAVDKATAGLIDTHGLLKAQIKATEAGLPQSAKLWESIGKIVVDVGRKHAEGPDALLARMNRLTDAISKGQTRALKEYGIDLENTEDLLLAQGEAIDKVIERANGLSAAIGAENMREGFSRLQNDVETTIGLMWGSVADTGGGLAGAFDAVHGAMGSFNDLMMSPDTKDAMQDYIWSLQGISDAIGSAIKMWGLGANALTQFGDSFVLTAAKIKAQGMLAEAGRAAALGTVKGTGQGLQQTGGLAAMTRATIPEETGGSKRRGGGGGRRAKAEPVYDMEFSLEESEASELEYMMGGEITAARKDWQMRLMDWEINSAAERDRQLYEQTIEFREAQWEQELQLEQQAEEYERQRHEWRMERLGIEESRRVSSTERAFGIEQQHLDASLEHWNQGVKGKSEMMAGFFGNMAAGMEIFGRKGFNSWKAFAIAETIASAIAGATKSYESLAGIPFAGPVLGGLAAASALAAGMANAAKISKLKYGDGMGGSSSAYGGGGYGSGGTNATGPTFPAAGGGQPVIVVNVEGSLSQAITGINAEYTNKVKSGEWSGWGSEGA